MRILNLETSGKFDIENVHVGRSWPRLFFQRWKDKQRTIANNYPEGTYRFEVFQDPEYAQPVKAWEGGQVISISANQLQIFINKIENTLAEGTYYHRATVDVSATESYQLLHGTLKIRI